MMIDVVKNLTWREEKSPDGNLKFLGNIVQCYLCLENFVYFEGDAI